jgi:hypothetical protein
MGSRPPSAKKSLDGGTGRQLSCSVKKISAVMGPPLENWAPPQKISGYVLGLGRVNVLYYTFSFKLKVVSLERAYEITYPVKKSCWCVDVKHNIIRLEEPPSVTIWPSWGGICSVCIEKRFEYLGGSYRIR